VKLSELIERLKDVEETHGDMEVLVDGHGMHSELEVEDLALITEMWGYDIFLAISV